MNLTLGTFLLGDDLLRTKSEIIFVRLSSLISDIRLKLSRDQIY